MTYNIFFFIKRFHGELRHTIGFEFIYMSLLMHDENVEFVNFFDLERRLESLAFIFEKAVGKVVHYSVYLFKFNFVHFTFAILVNLMWWWHM